MYQALTNAVSESLYEQRVFVDAPSLPEVATSLEASDTFYAQCSDSGLGRTRVCLAHKFADDQASRYSWCGNLG